MPSKSNMVFMKIFLVSVYVVAVTSDTPQQVEILTEKSFVNGNGYNFEYKTSDGVSRKEEAQLITVGENQGIGVKGSYSYFAPDGQQYIVDFTADDKGYQPEIRIVPQSSQ